VLVRLPAARADEKEANRLDADGLPLPERALCRLGSQRFLHDDFVTATAFSPDGKKFASTDVDGRLTVWEWPTGKRLRGWNFGPHLVFDPQPRFAPDNDHLFVWYGGSVHLWNATTALKLFEAESSCRPAFSPRSRAVAYVDKETTVKTRTFTAG